MTARQIIITQSVVLVLLALWLFPRLARELWHALRRPTKHDKP